MRYHIKGTAGYLFLKTNSRELAVQVYRMHKITNNPALFIDRGDHRGTQLSFISPRTRNLLKKYNKFGVQNKK